MPFKQEYNINLMYTVTILDPVTKNLEISSSLPETGRHISNIKNKENECGFQFTRG